VNPTSVGASLDDHQSAGAAAEESGECLGRGVECSEGVLASGALVNADDAVAPAQVDGDNRLSHRKPPVNEGN
jgi:hypothetical protein